MKVVISAGGTGGHINPALAIIDKIKEQEKDSKFLYIGTTDRMEKDIIPNKNIPYVGIQIKGLKRNLSIENIKTIFKLKKAINICKKEIKKFNPDIVIGAGGYVTFPVIYAGKKCKCKTLVHEQNSILGLSNKMALKYTDTLCTSFENMKIDKVNTVYTGNPCEEDARKKKAYDKTKYGFSKNKKLVLIVMGSLGSKTVNNILKKCLNKFDNNEYEIGIITGKDYYNDYKNLKKSKNVFIFPYIEDLSRLIKSCDLIVTRAGATTICEIIACKTPAIFIPSPYVTENHQYKNAMNLVSKNAAEIIEENTLNQDVLINKINDLMNNKQKTDLIIENLKKIGNMNSKTLIYEEIRKLIDSE